MTAPRFNAISVLVADMAATVEFYRRCGLTFADDQFPDGVEKAAHVEAHVGDFRLMFDTHAVAASFQPDWTPPSGPNHGISLAFDCGAPADVDRVYRELTTAGAGSHLEPFDAFWGQRYASVEDPDGNAVELYAALSGQSG